MQTLVLVKRLENFLKVLDVKMQEEGLYPEEVAAQAAARAGVTLFGQYKDKMGDDLFGGLMDPADPIIKTLRERLHLIEGDEAAIKMILEYLGYIRREVVPHFLALELEVKAMNQKKDE